MDVHLFSAVILAGGASRRMGRDKAWLTWQGDSLLARQTRLAKMAGAEEVFISGRPGVDYSALDCPVLFDSVPECGPLGGVERGLAATRHPLLLVLAVDLPFLEADLLTALLAECTSEVGAIPKHERGLEPLIGFYPQTCQEIARDFLQQQILAAHTFALECSKRNLIKLLPFESSRRDFTNLNRPEDAPNELPPV